jgi:hypothetical protein
MKSTPPLFFLKFFRSFCHPKLRDSIEGDLMELYQERVENVGKRKADRKFIGDVLLLFRPGIIKPTEGYKNLNNYGMMKNYFKMAQRSLLAYKGNTIVNVLGLVIGIASSLVILSVIQYELGFDAFHTNAKNIYRMVRVTGSDSTISDRSECRTGISYPVPTAIKEETTGIEKIASVLYFGGALIEVTDNTGKIIRFREEKGGALIEPSFFSIFDFKGTNFKWIVGSPEKSLTAPFSIVLTRSMAAKYFPANDALGNVLKFDKQFDCKVTGIIEDLPANTDFPFTLLVSYSTLKDIGGDKLNNWVGVDDEHQTYLVLQPSVTKVAIEKQIAKVHAAHTSKDIYESRHYLLQELKEIHFDPRFGNYNGRTISRETLWALALIAIFLLLSGSINYINLATAQSTMRSKEIGLRKVMGGNRTSLVTQLLTETFIVVLIAGILALGLSELLILNLHSLLNINNIDSYIFLNPFILKSLAFIIVMVTLVSGLYPSFIISKFNPVDSLKNKFGIEKIVGISLRKVLVVAQFAITQILVIGTFIVVAQMQFFRNTNMGFDKEAVVIITIPEQDPSKRKVMEDQLRSKAFISSVSFSYTLPSGGNQSYSSIGRMDATSSKDYIVYQFQSIDTAYLNLYKIKLLAGRNLTWQDSSHNILINKSLAKNLQLGTPTESIGKEVKMDGIKNVVGVFEDYHSSLKESVSNVVMTMNPKNYAVASVKLNLGNSNNSPIEAIRQIEQIWKASFPEFIFDYQFLDENIQAYYAQEEKYSKLFQLFSFTF